MTISPLSALANVHRVTTRFAGASREIFIFDHHRSAFPLWCHAARTQGAPLTLVSLDRHLDLNSPATRPPALAESMQVLDAYARELLAPTNDDHIVAAMEAGAVGDAVLVARSHAPPSLDAFRPYVDAGRRPHHCHFARNLDLVDDAMRAALAASSGIALDIDLDCFTTLSDGHLDEVLAWDAALVESFLRPPDSEPFWQLVLERCRVITIAREPFHCGGFERGAELWKTFSRAFFGGLLGVPAP